MEYRGLKVKEVMIAECEKCGFKFIMEGSVVPISCPMCGKVWATEFEVK